MTKKMDTFKVKPHSIKKEALVAQCRDLDHKLKQSAEYGSYLQKEHDQLKGELKLISKRLKLAIEACEGLNDEKEAAEKELEDTRAQLADAEQQVSQLRREMKQQREHIRTLAKASERDKQRLNEAKEKKTGVDGKLNEMAKTVLELESKLGNMEEESVLKDEKIVELQAVNDKLRQDLGNLEEQISELRAAKQCGQVQFDQLFQMVDRLKNKLDGGAGLDLEIDDEALIGQEPLGNRLKSIKADLMQISEKYSAMEARAGELEAQKNELTREEQRLRSENRKLVKTGEHLSEQNDKLRLATEQLRSKVKQLEEENEQLLVIRGMKEKLEEDHEELKMSYFRLEEQLGSALEANDELSKQHQLIRSKHEQVMKQLGYVKQARQELEKQGRQLDQQLQLVTNQLAASGQRADQLENALKVSEDRYRYLEDEMTNLRQDREQLSQQLEETRTNCRNLKQQLQAEHENKTRLSVECTDLSNSSSQLTAQLEKLRATKTQLESQLSSAAEEAANAKRQLAVVTDNLSIMSRKYRQTSDKLYGVESELKVAEQLKERWQDNCATLQAQLGESQSELCATKEALAELEARHGQLESSCQSLSKQLSQLINQKHEADASNNELQTHYESTKQQLALTADKNRQLEAEQAELKCKYSNLNQQLSDVIQAKSVLERQHEQLTARHETLRRRLADLEKSSRTLETRRAEVGDRCKQLENSCEQRTNALGQLQDAHALLDGEHNKLKLELSHSEHVRDQTKVEQSAVEDRYQSSCEQLDGLRSDKASLEHDHSQLRGMYGQAKLELAQTRQDLAETEAELMELQGKHQLLGQQLCTVQLSVDDADRRSTELRNKLNHSSDQLYSANQAERQLEERCAQLDDKLASTKRELDSNSSAKEQLTEQLLQQKSINNKAQLQLESANSHRQTLEQDIAELKVECQLTKDRLKSTSADKEHVEKEMLDVKRQCQIRQNQLDASNEARLKAEQLFSQLKAVHEQTIRDMDELVAAKASQLLECDRLASQLAVVKQQFDQLEAYTDQLEKRLSEMNKKYSTSSSELASIGQERDDLKRKLNEIERQCCRHRHELGASTKTRLDLEAVRDKLTLAVDKLTNDLQHSTDVMTELERANRRYKQQTERELGELRAYRKCVPDETPEATRQRLEIIEAAYSHLLQRFSQLSWGVESDRSVAETESGRVFGENSRLVAERVNLENVVEALKENEQVLREKLLEQEEATEACRESSDLKEQQLNAMLVQVGEAKTKAERALLADREYNQRRLARCRSDVVSRLTSADADQIVSLLADAERQEERLRDELRLRDEENELMQLRMEQLDAECRLYDKHVGQLERQVGVQRQQIRDAGQQHRETITILANGRLEEDLQNKRHQLVATATGGATEQQRSSTPLLSELGAAISANRAEFDDDSGQITTGLRPEVDGHKALEIKHFQMVDELMALKRALDKEREFRLSSDSDGRTARRRQHQTTEARFSTKERLVELMKSNLDIRDENRLLSDRLKIQQALIGGLASTGPVAAGVETRLASNGNLIQAGLSDVALRQIRLLQEQRNDLERRLATQTDNELKMAGLRDDKRQLTAKLQAEKDRLRAKWHEKELLEVELLRERLATEREARGYHQLEGLVRKQQHIDQQLSTSKRQLSQAQKTSVGTQSDHLSALSSLPAAAIHSSRLYQCVAGLDREMTDVLADIDYKLRARDIYVQVGDSWLPTPVYNYKRSQLLVGATGGAGYTTLCCGCRIEGFGREARIPCAYHSAVENLRSHLSKQNTIAARKSTFISTSANK